MATEHVHIGFGDVVEFATLDSGDGESPVSIGARFVITELISSELLVSAAKIMGSGGQERLSRSGTMEPPVRRLEVEPWDIGRIAVAMHWQFGPDTSVDQIIELLAPHATDQMVELPSF